MKTLDEILNDNSTIINLSPERKKLLIAATRLHPSDEDPTFDTIRERLKKQGFASKMNNRSLGQKLSLLQKDLRPHGIKLHRQGEKIFFDYEEIDFADASDLVVPEIREPQINVYMSPPRGGVGSKLFDPLVALGINIFLHNTYPVLAGEQLSDKPLAESVQNYFIIGGAMPEVYMTNMASDLASFVSAQLRTLDKKDMSEERLGEEKLLFSHLMQSNPSKDLLESYKEGIFGIIDSIDDAASYSSTIFETMLNGTTGKVIYQPGFEDRRNENHIRKRIEKKIREERSEFKKLESIITRMDDKVETVRRKRALLLHVLDEVQAAEDYIFASKARILKAYNMAAGEESRWNKRRRGQEYFIRQFLKNRPTNEHSRRTFEILYEQYLSKEDSHGATIEDRLKEGGIKWKKHYFSDMDQETIDELKSPTNAMMLGHEIYSIFERIRTYRGMGWRIVLPKSQITKMEGELLDDITRREILTLEKDDVQDFLYQIGWLEEKDFAKAKVRNSRLIDFHVKETLQELYLKTFDSFEHEILNRGPNFVDEFPLRVRTKRALSRSIGNGALIMMKRDLAGIDDRNEHIPDVFVSGPSGGTGFYPKRKHSTDEQTVPIIKFERRVETTYLIELAGMLTRSSIDDFVKKYPSARAGFPSETTEHGHIVVQKIDENGLTQHDSMGVEGLKRLALTYLFDNNGINPGNANYQPKYFVVPGDDQHRGEATAPTQIPSDWYSCSAAEYILKRFIPKLGPPHLLTISEVVEGNQQFRKNRSGERQYRLSDKQVDLVQKSIDSLDILVEDKLKLERAFNDFQRQGIQEPNVVIQAQNYKRSPWSKIIESTAAQGALDVKEKQEKILNDPERLESDFGRLRPDHYVTAIDGDHESRGSGSRGSESESVRSLWLDQPILIENKKNKGGLEVLADVNGEVMNYSDFIYANWEHASLVGYHFASLPDGRKMYITHKAGTRNGLESAQLGRLGIQTEVDAHTHHPKFQMKGARSNITAPGAAGIYTYIRTTNIEPSQQGVAALLLPEIRAINEEGEMELNNYRDSASFIFAPTKTIMYNNSKWMEKVDMRKLLAEMTPAAR